MLTITWMCVTGWNWMRCERGTCNKVKKYSCVKSAAFIFFDEVWCKADVWWITVALADLCSDKLVLKVFSFLTNNVFSGLGLRTWWVEGEQIKQCCLTWVEIGFIHTFPNVPPTRCRALPRCIYHFTTLMCYILEVIGILSHFHALNETK